MAPSRKKAAAKKESNIRSELRRDLLAIAMFAAGVFIAFCLWRRPAEGAGNGIGAIGYGVYQSCQFLFGQGKWFLVAALLLLGGGAWLKAISPGKMLVGAYTALILSACAILHLRLPNEQQFFRYGMQGMGGGLTGGGLVQASNLLIGNTGSWILYLSLVAASILLITGKTIRELLDGASGGARKIKQSAQDGLSMLHSSRQAKRQAGETGVLQSLNLPIETELRQDKQNTTTGRSIPFRDYASRQAEKNSAGTPSAGTDASAGEKQLKTTAKSRREKEDDSEFLPESSQLDADRAKASKKPRQIYRLPSITLLRTTPPSNSQRQNKVLADHVRILEKTLADFNLQATVTQVNKGPSITRFELQPAPGVKVSRIVGLSDDIALALAAAHIRIEAPIPGKAAIGIEVPNAERALVSLREILEDPAFKQSPSKLSFALGRDIAGASIIADLARMPHLLIAGATGSGKSVCINAIIVSILINTTPDEVKMMMIDPKMVELTPYNGIPHLIHPVVTDPKKAAKALRWAVHEMESRYDAFHKAGVRDIDRYNAWLGLQETEGEVPQRIPQIVIVIDELADLMLVAPADVEDSINRLSAMARAAGMHLVVATQRPSVDVITGVIKANIPSRIAFSVSSQTDSRVILDMAGAEKLLGRGDMLFTTQENPKPIRVQGVYVSDEEIEKLTDFIKTANIQPDYRDDLLTEVETDVKEENEELDALIPDAARIFIESGQASVSLLQRRLRIGYTRAGRIIDQMEELGIVGGYEGSKARAIRLSLAQYEERFGKKA